MEKKYIRNIIILSVLLVGFIVLSILVAVNNLLPFGVDNQVANWAYSTRGEKGGFGYWFFRIITEFGYTFFVIGIIIIMAIVWKFKEKSWFFAGTVLLSYITQKIIKAIVCRPRPDDTMWWMTESSTSFPSGHSITVACVFILLTFFIWQSPNLKKWFKILCAVISGVIIALVGLSRIILGVHFFSDVMGGLLWGSLIAVVGIITYYFYMDKMAKKASIKPINKEEDIKPIDKENKTY